MDDDADAGAAELLLADKFALEEFKLLRGEIELRGSEQRTMERNVVLADAAIYAALLFQKEQAPVPDPSLTSLINLTWCLPPLIGFLALIRWRESVRMIECLAIYLKDREQEVMGKGRGWETFLEDMRARGIVPIISRWYMLFWTIMLGGTAALAFYRNVLTSGWNIQFFGTAVAGLAGSAVAVFVVKGR